MVVALEEAASATSREAKAVELAVEGGGVCYRAVDWVAAVAAVAEAAPLAAGEVWEVAMVAAMVAGEMGWAEVG